MQDIVTITALIMAGLCFLLFFGLSINARAAATAEPARQMAVKAQSLTPVNVGELTDFVKALSTLSDSLAKAGPALTMLIGSILFLAIATVTSGAVVGKPAPVACASSKTVGANLSPGQTKPIEQPKQ